MNVTKLKIAGAWAVAALLAGAGLAQADVKVPALFSDHMVLQQGIDAPVWGTADAGEEVTVSVAGQKATTKAGADGKWMVKLKPLAATESTEMTIAGKNTISIKDVAAGEVWIASGQSNMEFVVRSSNMPADEKAQQNFPGVRHFAVQKRISEEPTTELNGTWQVTTPQTVDGFTAVGYYFGREVHLATKQPVGIIHSSWGGTPAEAWTDEESLKGNAELAPMLENGKKYAENYPKLKAKYQEDNAKYQEKAAKLKAEGKEVPKGPPAPKEPGKNPNEATVLYNGMIAPLVPYGIKGAVWYQGESNAGRAAQYRALLPTMIAGWRKQFGVGDFPFGIVSLANFMAVEDKPGESGWAELREAQAMTAAQPHNGLAIAIDVGDAKDIHPKDKATVGKRLAAWALADVYGKDVPSSGPVYDSMAVEGNTVRLKFKHMHGGLDAKGGDLKGFAIAGDDKKWVWADAKIDGDTIVVSSKDVAKPVAVRYAWANNPICNLYNKAGLPAVPFRTDTK